MLRLQIADSAAPTGSAPGRAERRKRYGMGKAQERNEEKLYLALPQMWGKSLFCAQRAEEGRKAQMPVPVLPMVRRGHNEREPCRLTTKEEVGL